ncbi:hypothetical protein CMI41_00650 [Candidatus Pacearchaeota archaeon]|nr:hypothetical protein [Candidatus Pacearchaeota archaeon]|tara:strand:- start:550 stop:3216 length:2667 start_codon:yes stop_codon:yes gene_type:complete
MLKRRRSIALLLLISILVLATISSAEEVIITYKDNPSQDLKISSVINIEENLNVTKKFSLVKGFVADVSKAEKELLEKNNEIIISEIQEYKAILDVAVPNINATDVWGVQINSTNITGATQSVCVLDTGVDYNHSAFGNCWGNNNESSSCVVIGGYDKINGDDNPDDDHGHGTHVAGIISSQHATYRGTAPGTKIIAMKVLNATGYGNDPTIASAIEWCIENRTRFNITAISLSLGNGAYEATTCTNALLDPLIQTAISNNISVVAAAGNCDAKTDKTTCDGTIGISSPACLSGVIPVGAVSDSDTQYYQRWSGWEVLAPGIGIFSAQLGGTYVSASGTSMSAPFVSATISMLQQYSKLKNNVSLNSTQVQKALNTTGFRINDTATSVLYPRIDSYSALGTLTNPQFSSISYANLSTVNTSTLTIPLVVTFSEEADFTYSINGSANKTGCSSCSIFNQTIVLPGTGNLTFNFYISDVVGNSNSTALILYINKTTPTYSSASYIGESTISMITEDATGQPNSPETLQVYVNGSNNLSISYPQGNYTINLTDSLNQTIVEFNYTLNETNMTLNLSDTVLMKGNTTSNNNSYLIVRGLNLTSQDRTKTIYLEKNLASNNTCVRDTETFSVNEFSSLCNAPNEYLINCPGSTGVYSCTLTENDTYYKISGMSYSAIQETGDFCGDGISNNGETCSSCSADVGACATPSSDTSGGSGGGGGGGGDAVVSVEKIEPTLFEMKQGFTTTVEEGNVIIFNTLNGEAHNITIDELEPISIKLTVNSDPITLLLVEGDEIKLNLSSREFYNLYIKINLIEGARANIKIQNIYEQIHKEDGIVNEEDTLIPKSFRPFIYFITAIAFIILIVFINRKINKLEKTNKKDEKTLKIEAKRER